VIICLSGAFG